MSYDNWWEDTDEDFKRKLIDQELEDADLQDNPIATEGWGVFLAKGLAKVGISSLENKLSQKSADKIMSVFKEPRVAQWIDIQAKLILKQASPYAKKFMGPDIKMTFATLDDVKKYADNPLNGVIDYDGTSKLTTDLEYKKCFTFDIKCGKYMLEVNADSTSIKRVFLFLKSSENSLCLATIKAPDDQELLKIVGAIESAEIVDESWVNKVKSFLRFKKPEVKKVKPKRDFKETLKIAKTALRKVLAMPEFKTMKPYVRIINSNSDDESVFGHVEFKYNLPGVDHDREKQLDAFIDLNNRFFEEMNKIVDDPAYRIDGEDKVDDHTIQLYINSNAEVTESYDPTPMTESLGLGAMIGAAAVGTFIGKQIKKNRDAKRQELAAAMKAESDEDYKAYLKKAEAWIPSRKQAINVAISIVKKYWTYTSFYPNPKGFCYDLFISGRGERVCIGSIREILDEEFYKVLDRTKAIINKELFKRFKGKYVVYFGDEYLFGDEDDEFDRKAGEDYVALVDMEAVKEKNKYWVKTNGHPFYTIDFGTRKPLTESFNIATEGWGVKAAENVEAAGWASAFFGCLATIFSFGYALNFKGIWAMIIGGYAVDKIGGGVKGLLQKKGNKYLEKVLANPEMSAYIRSAAKEVVAGIKKQAASMKDSKYEISTKAEDIDKFESSVFNQGFKAPGEETDTRIEFDRKSYFYIEKKLGEYSIVLLYDTNSIKGIYVVVAIKDTKDKFGSSWLRARPIPPPTSEELKKMGFKG